MVAAGLLLSAVDANSAVCAEEEEVVANKGAPTI